MIEIWRQCVTRVYFDSGGDETGYCSIGPLRAGGVLRELRMWWSSTGYMDTHMAVAFAGMEGGDAGAFRAATPLMRGPTTYLHDGIPGWYARVSRDEQQTLIIPMAVKVDTGARWVLFAYRQDRLTNLQLVLTATVIGFAKIRANGLGVEDGSAR